MVVVVAGAKGKGAIWASEFHAEEALAPVSAEPGGGAAGGGGGMTRVGGAVVGIPLPQPFSMFIIGIIGCGNCNIIGAMG